MDKRPLSNGISEEAVFEKVGKHSMGLSYDGATIGRIGLNLNKRNHPEVEITNIENGLYLIETDGEGYLQNWEELFADVIVHLKTLGR